MSETRFFPKGFGGHRPTPEQAMKTGWHENGIFAVAVNDKRLTWPERDTIIMTGNRLYGERKEENVGTKAS